MKTISTSEIMAMFNVSRRTVGQWAKNGVLTQLNLSDSQRMLFLSDQVAMLLPEHLRGKNLALVTPHVAMELAGIKSRDTLLRWAEGDDILTRVVLPACNGNPRHRRYVRAELRRAMMIPLNIALAHLTTFTDSYIGLSESRLRAWIARGILPAEPSLDETDPFLMGHDVRRCLVKSLYL